jgi:hypothetical protein
MAEKKKSSRKHILLWVGLGMIGAAIVLALIGARGLVFRMRSCAACEFRRCC